MKVTGLIAEYNPLHNGHAYHMKQARLQTGCDYLVAVISGDFVQRGEPAIVNKYVRTRMALACGADLVLELPASYACGSAEFFAQGAVSLLDQLGVVNALCFGSEAENLEPLTEAASVLAREPKEYRRKLKAALKEGRSFPSARAQALENHLNEGAIDALSHPNNILGIEYLKALNRLNSSIVPYSIPRIASGYHAKELDEQTGISSATSIRKALLQGDSSVLKSHMPRAAYELLMASLQNACPVTAEDFSLLLHDRLINATVSSLCSIQDIGPDLAKRICNYREACTTFEDFVRLLKTKQMTEGRIRRCLIHLLLSIETEQVQEQIRHGWHSYVRILGFRKSAANLLTQIHRSCPLPLITAPARALSQLDGPTLRAFRRDLRASELYEAAAAVKFHRPPISELRQKLLVL